MIFIDLIMAFTFEQAHHIGIVRSQLPFNLGHRSERLINVVKFVAYLSNSKIDLLLAELGVQLRHTVVMT